MQRRAYLQLAGFICLLASGVVLSVEPQIIDVAPGSKTPGVAAARNLIRARRSAGEWLKTPIVVNIQPGRYSLEEPLSFSSEDSGSPDAPITYRSAGKEPVVLTAGQRITGWQDAKVNGRNAWVARLPDPAGGEWDFHTLYVNNQARFRPRRPDQGFYRFTAVPGLDPKAAYRPGQDRAHFEPGHLASFRNLGDVDIVVLHYWVAPRMRIAAIDEAEHLVTFTSPTLRRLSDSFDATRFARYYVDNVFEDLKVPGQWYLDRPARTLYYLPKAGETPDNTRVVVPRVGQLLRVEGNQKPVEHLRFDKLTLTGSEYYDPKANPSDRQSSTDVPGAVYLAKARDCRFSGCVIENVCNYAIEIAAGCENIAIENCRFSGLGAGGVKVGPGSRRTTITGCEIGPGGFMFHNAVGVWIGHSDANRVAHNHIHHFYYTGVSVGWTWGYRTPSQASGNIVEFNHMHDLGQGWLSDMAGVYTLGVSPGTVIRNNVIHDVQADKYGGWGLYTDEGSSGIVMENNVVYRTTHGGFHQHYGKDNFIRNNVLAFGENAQIMRTRQEEHTSFTFERNIVYFSTPQLLGGNWSNDRFNMDYNLYWRTGGQAFNFKAASLDEWRTRGHDRHSLVADPLFTDPANGDFSLKPDSPAGKIGFQPIDVSRVGPRSGS